jgi:tetratricopeptide (TPR) repeat protein
MWLGPANLAPAVREIYSLSDRMRRSATGALRRELLDVAGVYAEFSGWLHQAVGDFQGAVEWTERALQQAHAAGDGNLVAYVYFRMGQLAEAQGDTDRVIGLARAAQREHDLSPEVRAIALHQEASGHAVAGDVSACLKKLEEASAVTTDAHGQWTDEYRIGSFCDQRYSDLCKAGCLLELGSLRDAVALYEDKQLGRGMDCGWEPLQMAKLARAYAASGEPEHAAALGFQALAMSRNHRSALVLGELRRLDKWSDVPAIAALTGALSAPVTTDATRRHIDSDPA